MKKVLIIIYIFGVVLCWTGVRSTYKRGVWHGKPNGLEMAMCFVPVANIIWGTLFHLNGRDFSKFFQL